MGLRNRYLFKDEKCFFVTTTCVKWLKLIQLSNAYEMMEESLEFVNLKYNCSLLAYVLMPNHLHLLTYFTVDNHLSDYIRDFKKFTSVMIRKRLDNSSNGKMVEQLRIEKDKRVFQVWQDRFDDRCIKDVDMLEAIIDYIHNNPLQERWSLVKRPEDYQYSSAMFYELGTQPNCQVVHYKEYY